MSKKERIELANLLHDEDFTISSICLSGHRRFPLGDPCEDKKKKFRNYGKSNTFSF